MSLKKPKIRKLKNIAIRLAIVCTAYGVLYHQLLKRGDLADLWNGFLSQFEPEKGWLPLALVAVLMVVNWSLEALKWRLLIRKSEKVTFLRSLKGVLTGISVGTLTPNRLGEFLGRSFVLDRSHPWKVFFMTAIGSYSQLLATIIFGAVGLLLFTHLYAGFSTGTGYLDGLIAFFAILTVLFLLILYFNIDLLDKHLGPWIRRRKPGFASWFHVISEYNTRELMGVLGFSFLRYFTFSFQFFLLIRFFQLPIPLYHTLIFTSVIYLVMTLIPSVALSEIGVRGSVSLFFFEWYFPGQAMDQASSVAIISTSTLLWLINIVLPALLGTFFVYHLRVFRNGKTPSQ